MEVTLPRRRLIIRLLAILLLILCGTPALAQRGRGAGGGFPSEDEQALQKGITLTRQGKFDEAIPQLLKARSLGREGLAVEFNLALCYVGTQQFDKAVEVLNSLRGRGGDTAEVENLLAQSYVGMGKPDEALSAAQQFAKLAPKNEKLFLFAADACMQAGDYAVGLKMVELGLKSLPKSAKLIFQHGMFLSQLDQFDIARADFKRTQELAPGSDIAYIAGAQEQLYDGNMEQAVKIARQGIDKGNTHFLLLTIYGEAVLGAGVPPGQTEFFDAQAALEKVVTEHPNFAGAQLSLGKLYLAAGHVDHAIARLEAARRLDGGNAAVYSNLANAYRRAGNSEKVNEALETLSKLNRQQVEKIGAAPGDRKAGYATRAPRPPQP
jgi:tetratricopeptide (TPR) repeat protein